MNEIDRIHNLNDTSSIQDDARQMQMMGRKKAKDRQRVKGKSVSELKRVRRELSVSTQIGRKHLALFPGGQVLDDVILVGGSTRIPAVRRLVRVMTGIEPRSSVNVDEAVSLGAAVMAGILDGDITDMTVMTAWQAAMVRAFASTATNTQSTNN